MTQLISQLKTNLENLILNPIENARGLVKLQKKRETPKNLNHLKEII